MASLNYLWMNRIQFPMNSPKFYKVWAKRFYSFPELVIRNKRRWMLTRQGAQIHESAEIGEVTVDGHKHKLSIGAHSFLGQVYMALHDRIIIGEKVCINDGVRILTASHDVGDPEWKHTKEQIVIDDFVWIGMGAIILPGVHLGRGAVVGAGAVVARSVAPGDIVVGNPAKKVNRARCQDFTYNPCEFLAANRAWLLG